MPSNTTCLPRRTHTMAFFWSLPDSTAQPATLPLPAGVCVHSGVHAGVLRLVYPFELAHKDHARQARPAARVHTRDLGEMHEGAHKKQKKCALVQAKTQVQTWDMGGTCQKQVCTRNTPRTTDVLSVVCSSRPTEPCHYRGSCSRVHKARHHARPDSAHKASHSVSQYVPDPNSALTSALPRSVRSSTVFSLPSIAALTSSMRL